MSTRRLLYAATLAAACLAVPAGACRAEASSASSPKGSHADTYTLRYKFQPGETIRWEVVHRAKVKTTVSGTTQTAETVSKSVKAWRVKDVRPDGQITFEHVVESVDMWQKLTGRQEVRYNSQTDAAAPPGFENVAKSVGVPLALVTMDAAGKVLSRSGSSKAETSENEGGMTIPLPADPIAVGQSWSFPYEIDVPYGPGGTVKRIKTVQKFTLAEVKAGNATIQLATQILTPVHNPAIEAQLIQRESAGTVRFDVDAGRVVGQQMDVDKQVVGFSGEASSLHYLTRFTEELLPETSRTAARPKAGAAKPD